VFVVIRTVKDLIATQVSELQVVESRMNIKDFMMISVDSQIDGQLQVIKAQ